MTCLFSHSDVYLDALIVSINSTSSITVFFGIRQDHFLDGGYK